MTDPDSIHVLAGDCDVRADETTHRGEVVVLIKPDNTVLVHDVDGYQPVAWLTRAESVARTTNGRFSVTAIAGDRTLRVESRSAYGFGRYPGSRAGIPVGDCPGCSRVLVRAGGRVSCPGCVAEYGLPDGASVLEERCTCGLPRMRISQGRRSSSVSIAPVSRSTTPCASGSTARGTVRIAAVTSGSSDAGGFSPAARTTPTAKSAT